MTAAVDDKGRILLPKHIRDQLGLAPGTPVQMLLGPEGVTIRAARDRRQERLEWIRRLAGSIKPENRDLGAGFYDAERIKKEVWGGRL